MPLQLGPKGVLLICKIYWDVLPNLVDFTQKVCKHGSHYDPPKKKKEIPKQGRKSTDLGKFVINYICYNNGQCIAFCERVLLVSD